MSKVTVSTSNVRTTRLHMALMLLRSSANVPANPLQKKALHRACRSLSNALDLEHQHELNAGSAPQPHAKPAREARASRGRAPSRKSDPF